jgi:hypothetical protein
VDSPIDIQEMHDWQVILQTALAVVFATLIVGVYQIIRDLRRDE